MEAVSFVTKWDRWRWFEHIECKDDGDWITQCMLMETEGTRWRGRLRKTWWDCVNDGMKRVLPSHEDALEKNDGELKPRGQPANAGVPAKWLLK